MLRTRPQFFKRPASLSGPPLAVGPPTINAVGNGAYPSTRPDVVRKLDFLKRFFSTWLHVDPATLAAALTIGSAMFQGASFVRGMAGRIYFACIEFLTASISIPSYDDLNKDVLLWLGANVLKSRSPRMLAARTDDVGDVFTYFRDRKDPSNGKKTPINFLPGFDTVWFMHERNIFIIHRPYYEPQKIDDFPQTYVEAPNGDEPLVIMVIGRSINPIRRLLETVRDFADEERRANVNVRVAKLYHGSGHWDNSIKRPMRTLETVHFDEKTKADLVADIELYLDPSTRHYYTARGIPYRRGYLLHGPPGTGKTSLCLALATHFRLEVFLLHLPSVENDVQLETLFKSLPPRCIVLLEDIDAVGRQRKSDMEEMEEAERKKKAEKERGKEKRAKEGVYKVKRDEEDEREASPVTLSGLLNVLDGVTSQEGRIVIMTSNFASKLDKALTRPGRIDLQVFLGNMSSASARLLFLRMYQLDSDTPSLTPVIDTESLHKLAMEFSTYIPEDTFTPAQLQGFLITHRHSAANAVKATRSWVESQQRLKIEEEERAKRLAAWKAAKKAEEEKDQAKEKEEAKENGEDEDEPSDDDLKSLLKQIASGLVGSRAKGAAGGLTASVSDAASSEENWSSANENAVDGKDMKSEGSSSGSTPSTHSSDTDSPKDSQSNSSWNLVGKQKGSEIKLKEAK